MPAIDPASARLAGVRMPFVTSHRFAAVISGLGLLLVMAGCSDRRHASPADAPPPVDSSPETTQTPPAEMDAEAAAADAPVDDRTQARSLPAPEYELVDPLPTDPVLDMLLEGLQGDDDEMRSVAIDTAVMTGGDELSAWCIAHVRAANPRGRAALVEILGRTEDMAGLTTALEATRDPDESVRLAGVRAAAAIGKDMVVGPLTAILARPGRSERTAARTALTSIREDAATVAIAEAIDEALPEVQRELLQILAMRNATSQVEVVLKAAASKDRDVRLAALKSLGILGGPAQVSDVLGRLTTTADSGEQKRAEKTLSLIFSRIEDKGLCAKEVLCALDAATGVARCSLLRTLGRLGAPSGLPPIRDAIGRAEPDLEDAGIRALADWPDASVAGELLELARTAQDEVHRVVAFRGYVRAVGLPSERPAARTLAMLLEADDLASGWGRIDERKLVVSGLAQVLLPESLAAAMRLMGTEGLALEAGMAAVIISEGLSQSHPDLARQALAKVLATVEDEGLHARAMEAQAALE